MYANNELFFPHHVIPTLRKLRGAAWERLIDRVTSLPELHEETLALMLMMIRLGGCVSCETDSFRAMRGCAACAAQTLRRYKGSDDDLLSEYDHALADVRVFVAGGLVQFPPSVYAATVAETTDCASSGASVGTHEPQRERAVNDRPGRKAAPVQPSGSAS
jgi:hypothetical protein